MKVIHRDIKPQNIFILTKRDEKGNAIGKQVKIADFGFAKNTQTSIPLSFAGTPHFMSPEMFSNDSYDFPSDMWSIGVSLYCIFVRNRVKKNIDFKNELNKPNIDITLKKNKFKL